MTEADAFTVVRDPLWNNIQLDPHALEVLDSEPFQRLRYVRQLGHAFLVYPSANHTRFEHALGAYHLARRALHTLRENGELDTVSLEERTLIPLAALLHDIGHYPFSHALEEAGLPSHEAMASEHFQHPDLQRAFAQIGILDLPSKLEDLIVGRGRSPLRGLISGSLDLDKIEYLTRDARMAGVPYGAVDVDRLLHALTLVTLADGDRTIGVRDKGVSALESLLFAKYQMYRNVYWHHAVRSATAMFKRAVRTAIADQVFDAAWVARSTDEALMETLRQQSTSTLPSRLRRRVLHKRVLDVGGAQVPAGTAEWIAEDPDFVERVENRLAKELNVSPGEILIDYPKKQQMLEVDLPLRTRRGDVTALGADPMNSSVGIQEVAEKLHTIARRLRVFVSSAVHVPPERLATLVTSSRDELQHRLHTDQALLG